MKSALKAVTAENPFRGPAVFEQDRFIYKCSWQGNVADFNGYETIYFDGIKIYRLSFHGGYIK